MRIALEFFVCPNPQPFCKHFLSPIFSRPGVSIRIFGQRYGGTVTQYDSFTNSVKFLSLRVIDYKPATVVPVYMVGCVTFIVFQFWKKHDENYGNLV